MGKRKDIPLRPAPKDFERKHAGGFAWDPSRPLSEQYPWCDFAAKVDAHLTEVDRVTDERLVALIASAPDIEPPPGWQQRVHEACDDVDREAYDKRTGTARHTVPVLDGIDQSDPVVPEAPLVEAPDIHSEPTHVAEVDSRFDNTDGEL